MALVEIEDKNFRELVFCRNTWIVCIQGKIIDDQATSET